MAQKEIRALLPSILKTHFGETLLQKHAVSVVGYGSGVFPQSAKPTNNTIDIIIIVRNSDEFHRDNIAQRPLDYSGLPKYLGASYLNILNKHVFPVHFNHIYIGGTKLKYAVVDVGTFMYDLQRWNYLTFAGRMHKPVAYNIIHQPELKQLTTSIHNNYRMGLGVGLLKLIGRLPNEVHLDTIFNSVSNISYAGDIRHTMAVENSSKVDNIVNHNRQPFMQIYQPILRQLATTLPKGTLQLCTPKIRIKYTPELVHKLVSKDYIPDNLLLHLEQCHGGMHKYKSLTHKLLVTGINFIPKQIETKLASINKKSSMKMAMENFLGASLIHNAKYVLAKIKKKGTK